MPLPGAAKTVQSGFAQGAADWRSGQRWSATSMLYLVHPFASSRHFTHREACHWIRGSLLSPMNPVPLPPQGETRDMREKTASHILHVPFRRFPPLVAGATTLPGGKHVTGFAGRLQFPYESSSFATPASGGTIKLREAIFFIKWLYAKHGLFCFRLRGKSRAARIGGGECSEPVSRMFFMPYDTESQFRNALVSP